MIVGTGIDIAEIARFEASLDRYGERFARRILTGAEIRQFAERKASARFLASRFAAKEAASKALGCGIAQGVVFHSLEVSNDAQGKPLLTLHGAALEKATSLGVANCHLSLSDERHYAVAMVVLESL